MIPIYISFFKYNLLGIEGISDSKFWGKDPWMFRKFRVENGEENSKRTSVGLWGTAPLIAPHDSLYPYVLG